MKWRAIKSVPHNQRVIVAQDGKPPNDEIAIAWKDRLDDAWYYAPQGGRLWWLPTHWMPIPDEPGEQ
jgi:hypothetical protein